MQRADKTILKTETGQGTGRASALATDRVLLQGRDMECHCLDDHFLDPCVIRNAACVVPDRPGLLIKMKPASLQTFCYRE